MKADLISFNAAISACEKAGHWQGDPAIPQALKELHLDYPSTLLATATILRDLHLPLNDPITVKKIVCIYTIYTHASGAHM